MSLQISLWNITACGFSFSVKLGEWDVAGLEACGCKWRPWCSESHWREWKEERTQQGLKERLPRHNEYPVEVETMNLSCFPSARLGCFLQAALSGPGVGAEKVDKWIALSLGDLQDGYDRWTMVSEGEDIGKREVKMTDL